MNKCINKFINKEADEKYINQSIIEEEPNGRISSISAIAFVTCKNK